MSDGVSVGKITLDLEVMDTIQRQLTAISAAAEKTAGKTFAGVGDAIADTVSKPIEQIGRTVDAAVKAPAEAACKQVEQTIHAVQQTAVAAAKAVKTETGALFPDEPARQSMLAWDQVSSRGPPDKPAAKVEIPKWDVAVDAVGLLEQKLDIVNAQIGDQQRKLQSLLQQYAAVGNTAAGDKLDSQITAVQSRLVSLQGTAAATEAKLAKALDGSPGAAKTEQAAGKAASEIAKKIGGASKAVSKAMSGVKGSVSRAFSSAGKSAGRHLDGIKHKAGGLARSVKSAFKSAFLMAGLYAAFRGAKALIGDAATQNKEFADSLNLIKSNLLVAFTPIMQAVQPALNALASGFAAVSRQVAQLTAGLMGQSYQQALAATKQMQAVSKAAKQASGSTSIDELNVLSSGEAGSAADLSALDTAKYEDAAAFGARVKEMLTNIAAGAGAAVAGIAQQIAAGAPGVITAAAGVVNALLGGLNANFPAIRDAGVSLINTVLDGAAAILPQVGTAAVNIIDMLLTGLITGGPRLLVMGVTLLDNVLDGISSRLPALIPQAQAGIQTIVTGLQDGLPSILQSGIDIVVRLADGISGMLPSLIPAAIGCILTLVETLTSESNLGKILGSAVLLIKSLADGIINALPRIVESAPRIVSSLVGGLVDAIPKLVDAAVDIVAGLAEYIVHNLGNIASAAIKIQASLSSGLIRAIPQLLLAVPKLVKALIDGILNTDWLQVGKDIIAGIGDGLLNGVKSIGGAIKDAAGGIVDGFKDFFGIHSPSRLFRDKIGTQLAAGIGVGFGDAMPAVVRDMERAIPTPELPLIGRTAGAAAGQTYADGYAASAAKGGSMVSGDVLQLLLAMYETLQEIVGAVKALDLVVKLYANDREIARSAARGQHALGAAVVTG